MMSTGLVETCRGFK